MKTSISFILLSVAVCALLPSCEKDDSSFSDYDFSKYSLRSQQGDDDEEEVVTLPDTIALAIAWNGAQATITGDTGDSVTIAQSAGDITVTSTTQRYLQITVSGTCPDGSLLVYSDRMWGLVLNGLTLTNNDGPAINNQGGHALYVTLADSTENALADGSVYADAPKNAAGAVIDQKATFFSEGQVYISGNGSLSVTANSKNGIASDDFLVIEAAPASGPTIAIQANGTNGIKVNDGMEIYGGTLTIDVTSDGGRGIKNDASMTIAGGRTTITTTGDCRIETADGIIGTTSCAGIKCDSTFTMTAGELTILSTGDGGKGINSGGNVEMKGGTLVVTTTGGNEMAKPKGVKSDTGIILSGGSFTSKVNKSWACDNGSDSSNIIGMITIVGTPNMETLTLKKKEVIVEF